MFRLSNVLCILVSVAIFSPYPTWEHFIWPLKYCVLADICNHTWIPECGVENGTTNKRLFIDECDMWEYNCDFSKVYLITNYSDCFGYSPCPTAKNFYRMGDYKYVLEGRKIIYAPTLPHTHSPEEVHTHQNIFIHTSTVPMLPARMLHGKRRYTPEAYKLKMQKKLESRRQSKKKIKKQTFKTTTKRTTKTTTKILPTTKRPTVVLKQITVMKNVLMYLKCSIQHYVEPLSECLQADTCNHTWIPQCGRGKKEMDLVLFSDDCHRHEYNCDSKKDYENVEMSECEITTTTEPTTTTTEPTTTTTEPTTTTTEPTTTTTEPTTTTTEPTTTTTEPTTTTTEPTTTTTEPTTTTTASTTTTTTTKSTVVTPRVIIMNHNCSRIAPPTVKPCSNNKDGKKYSRKIFAPTPNEDSDFLQ